MSLLITLFIAQVIVYCLLTWGLARLLVQHRSFSRIAILLSCLIIGLASGLLTAWLWPRFDSVVFPNMAASILGDQIYVMATRTVPPGTTSPHLAVMWPLRIPQVYVFGSVLLFGAVGLGLQALYNKRRP